jgi:formyltetrahydrofolate deformylase
MTLETQNENQYILNISCDCRIGTLARISEFLTHNELHITELQQYEEADTGRLFARIGFKGSSSTSPSLPLLREEFQLVAASEQMAWTMFDADQKLRVVVMVSEMDHCLADLIYRTKTNDLKMEIMAVVSNHMDLHDYVIGQNIRYIHLPITPESKESQEAKLVDILTRTKSELVILARYMQIFSDNLCMRLRGHAINIHHSFLPAFKGANPYHQAHTRGVKLIGATAHYVTSELDEGPIIEQELLRVRHDDLPEKLIQAGRDIERRALSTAVRLHIERRIFLNSEKTVIFK